MCNGVERNCLWKKSEVFYLICVEFVKSDKEWFLPLQKESKEQWAYKKEF